MEITIPNLLIATLILSFLSERLAEVVVMPLIEGAVKAIAQAMGNQFTPTPLLSKVQAAATGLLLSVGFSIDFVSPLVEPFGASPNAIIGTILTGLVIAGGSAFVHDIMAFLRQPGVPQ